MKKRIQSVILVIVMLCSCALIGCKGKDKIIDEIPNEGLKFVAADWEPISGTWEMGEAEVTQNDNASFTRLMYKPSFNQEWAQISVDVLIGNGGKSAGIEFRTDKVLNPNNRSAFLLDADANKTIIMTTTAERGISVTDSANVPKNSWQNIKIELNGANGKFFINGNLAEERSDFMAKEAFEQIALVTNGSNIKFRNFKYSTDIPANLKWEELIKQSNLKKDGFDRYNAIKFEYPYVGMGKTTLLVGPNGFINEKAPKPLATSDNYRNDPMLIYDYWWDDAIKVDPFTFGGEYMVDGWAESGKIENDGITKYSQEVNVSTGNLTSDLVLNVADEMVKTTREMIVNEDGVVIMKVVSDTDKDFMFTVKPRSPIFGGRVAEAIDGGFVIRTNLRTDTVNNAYLAVKASSPSNLTVNVADGTILVKATKEPMYFYLSPASDLNESGTAKANSVERLNKAVNAGYSGAVNKAKEWYDDFYSRSQISIPDLSVAKWYVRSLFYNAVSMAGTRVPPGCYGNNVEGFFGGPCLEFDLMFSQLGMLYVNQPQISQTTVDWIDRIKENSRDLAENGYTDKTGHTLDPLVPGGYLFGWITGYDGTPTHGAEVGHEQGWVSLFAGANYANACLAQAEYTDSDLDFALDILMGQGKTLMSFFEFNAAQDIYVHKGVWAGGNNYSAGAFSESMAAVYTIETALKYMTLYPEKFSQADKQVVNGWAEMLPKIPPYGDKITTAYDPQKGAYILLHTTSGIKETVVDQSGIVGGPTNKPYMWYKTIPYNHYSTKPTMLAIAESGQFDYNFNTGWSAAVMGRALESEFAAQYNRFQLRPTSLYDDFYFCENKNDGEDFERAPALGGNGAFIMALASQLVDGDETDSIRFFPAINQIYQQQGADFNRFLAKGNIEVSGSYREEKTTVKLFNKGKKDAVRDVYIRIKEGSGVGESGGKEYSLVDDCFIMIPAVKIEAGKTVELTAIGKEKELTPNAFKAQFPVANARGIRTQNVAFGWERAGNAEKYQLVISKNADLSSPVYDINANSSTFYYPLNAKKQINLEEGVKYYWTVYAVHGDNAKMMTDGIISFKTLSSTFTAFGKDFEVKGGVEENEGQLIIKIPSGANDTANRALITPQGKNFTLTTCLKYKPTVDHQQAGIMLYINDGDYVKVTRAFTSGSKCFEYKTASGSQGKVAADNLIGDTVYLRFKINSTQAMAYFSADGENFTLIDTFSSTSFYTKSFKIGLFGSVWSAKAGGQAAFTSFDIVYD